MVRPGDESALLKGPEPPEEPTPEETEVPEVEPEETEPEGVTLEEIERQYEELTAQKETAEGLTEAQHEELRLLELFLAKARKKGFDVSIDERTDLQEDMESETSVETPAATTEPEPPTPDEDPDDEGPSSDDEITEENVEEAVEIAKKGGAAGFFAGLASGMGDFWDKVKEFFGKLTDGVKDMFGNLFGKKEEEGEEGEPGTTTTTGTGSTPDRPSGSRESRGSYEQRGKIDSFEELPDNPDGIQFDFGDITKINSDVQHQRQLRGRDPKDHHGIDINTPNGTPIRSPGYGRILYNRTSMSDSAGWYIDVEYKVRGESRIVRLMHMQYRSPLEAGALVHPRDLLGYTGDTAKTRVGAHLHLEVRDGTRSGRYDPDVPGDVLDPYNFASAGLQAGILRRRAYEYRERKGRVEDEYWADGHSDERAGSIA